MTTSTTTRAGDDATIAAVEQLVADLQEAQQRESVDAFVALMREDAVWVTAMGKRLTGRPEIEAFTRRVLPGAMRDSTAVYEVAHVTFIRPDVAAVNVRQRPVTHDGEPLADEPQGSPLYVLSREADGRWLIAAGQNTRIQDADTLAAG
jgi:uncharacterized protein (TIGR02246 family)